MSVGSRPNAEGVREFQPGVVPTPGIKCLWKTNSEGVRENQSFALCQHFQCWFISSLRTLGLRQPQAGIRERLRR